MGHALLYQAIKHKFLECRRAAHEGTLTPSEAGEEYTKLGGELAETYGSELAEKVMNEFTSDLTALTWMERLDHFGLIATAIGYVSGWFFSEARAIRVTNLNDEIVRLDAEYYKHEPGDTS
mgnify:CR=1 FL=1